MTKRKRAYLALGTLALVALVLLTAGCLGRGASTAGGDGKGAQAPIVLEDALGRTVTLERMPERIVSLVPSQTEVFFALGQQGRLVGVDSYSNYPPEALKIEQVGGMVDPNVERIVALKPDLVFAVSAAKEAGLALEKLGIKVFVVGPEDFDGVYKNIELVGRITGAKEAAARLVKTMKDRAKAIEDKVAGLGSQERPRVFYEVWDDPLITAGPGTFINSMIHIAGGFNIAGDAGDKWPQFSLEMLVKRDPEVIIVTSEEKRAELLAGKRQGWASLAAVKQGRVYVVDEDLVSRPGPRLVDGLEMVARAIHPESF